jgi:hypothetical protein
MKKSPMFMFFDDIWREYQSYYGEKAETRLINDLKKYLSKFSKTSEIMIITHQNVSEITDWFLKNDLFQFVDDISNPALKSIGRK